MLYLILSILCSVSVGIIFKITRAYTVSITQVLAANYAIALVLCYLFFLPDITVMPDNAPWAVYAVLIALMPSVFLFLASSVKHMGIVKTDAAQRLSLFIPILAAWLYFGENFDSFKIAGLAFGFPAIALILYKKHDNVSNKWYYPAIVLVGFGIVDILFKQLALHSEISYTSSLFIIFCGALAVTVIGMVYEMAARHKKLNVLNFAFGALVGIFNFGNILFYLKAHLAFSENPSTVFAAMNMGVIITGSFVGIFIFSEKLSRINYIGILLALAAIILITLSQLNA